MEQAPNGRNRNRWALADDYEHGVRIEISHERDIAAALRTDLHGWRSNETARYLVSAHYYAKGII